MSVHIKLVTGEDIFTEHKAAIIDPGVVVESDLEQPGGLYRNTLYPWHQIAAVYRDMPSIFGEAPESE